MTGPPEVIGSEVMQGVTEETEINVGGHDPKSIVMTGETERTSGIQDKSQTEETLGAENYSLQENVESGADTRRTQRVRRAPSRLTYDTPGHPHIIVAPIVRYVSCFYKWIGSPVST